MQLKILFLFFCVLAIFTSCNDQPTCIPEQTDLLKITFVDELGKNKEITLASLTVDNSNENFPVIKDTTESNFSVPLNPLASSVIIRFNQNSTSNYIALSYKATPIVLNPACAIETQFDFLSVDSTNFIDAKVTDILLSLETSKNVEITH